MKSRLSSLLSFVLASSALAITPSVRQRAISTGYHPSRSHRTKVSRPHTGSKIADRAIRCLIGVKPGLQVIGGKLAYRR